MIIGETGNRRNPTLQVPPWSFINDPKLTIPFADTFAGGSPDFSDPYKYLPSNDELDSDSDESEIPVDAFSCDHFRMFEFKVRRCARARSHDWTDCPYAHPGEKARRRDPRRFHYSGTACPDFRKGSCRKGDACESAHGVFECWLHPARYRTQPCKDGTSCRRRVCFFAHTPEQLRILPPPSPRLASVGDFYDGSPLRQAFEATLKSSPFNHSHSFSISISPPATPPSESPPLSPLLSHSLGSSSVSSVSEIMASMRNMQLNKMKSMPASWYGSGTIYGSPRGPMSCSVPSTPTARDSGRAGLGRMGAWVEDQEMERVESGSDVRARMFEKLSMENYMAMGVGGGGSSSAMCEGPDVGWISDLVK